MEIAIIFGVLVGFVAGRVTGFGSGWEAGRWDVYSRMTRSEQNAWDIRFIKSKVSHGRTD